MAVHLPENEIILPSRYRGMEAARPTLAYSNEYCRRITEGHYENFPVASLFIPPRLRQHIANIYAFARIADDFADEPAFEGIRMERLDEWEEELSFAYRGKSIHPVFVALSETIHQFSLPEKLFKDLIHAFKIDVVKNRYKNFDEILYYCRHSANPVGRLVLLLFGYENDEWFSWSDSICTALQLANFWQDVSVDLKKNRIYIPQEEMVEFGVTEYDLEDGRLTDGLRKLITFQVERTEDLFLKGKPLCTAIPDKRLRLELKLTWQGGMTILQKIRANGYNVFKRPSLARTDWLRILTKTLVGL